MENMKRIFAALAATLLCLVASAQAQITTKKMKISDFQDKTMRVVMTGNSLFDECMKSEFRDHWSLSSYEFCSADEFEESKTSPDYYFFMLVTGQFKKESEPGIDMLTVVKGGIGSTEGIDAMYDVATVPFRPSEDQDGREFVLLPALLDIIQDYIQTAMKTDIEGYAGLGNYTINLPKTKNMNIVIAEEDLADEITPAMLPSLLSDGMSVEPADDVDDCLLEARKNTVVSFTVAPINPVKGSYCYKMLIGCEDHTLYYYRRHKISRIAGAGFLTEDVKRIASRK